MDKSVHNYSSNVPRALGLSPYIGAGDNGTVTNTPTPATLQVQWRKLWWE